MRILLVVVQSNLQQPLPFGELEEDFRSVYTIRGVEVTPDLKSAVRYEITSRKSPTYVNLASTQQFIPANGLVVVYPDLDLGLAGADHESALFIPKNVQKGNAQRFVKSALPATFTTRRLGTVRGLVLLASRFQNHVRFESVSTWVVIFRLDDCDSHDSGLGGMFTRTRDTLAGSGEHTLTHTHTVSTNRLGSLARSHVRDIDDASIV